MQYKTFANIIRPNVVHVGNYDVYGTFKSGDFHLDSLFSECGGNHIVVGKLCIISDTWFGILYLDLEGHFQLHVHLIR